MFFNIFRFFSTVFLWPVWAFFISPAALSYSLSMMFPFFGKYYIIFLPFSEKSFIITSYV